MNNWLMPEPDHGFGITFRKIVINRCSRILSFVFKFSK